MVTDEATSSLLKIPKFLGYIQMCYYQMPISKIVMSNKWKNGYIHVYSCMPNMSITSPS